MEPKVRCDLVLDGINHVTAACFHPKKPTIMFGSGDQIIEVDVLSGATLWRSPAGSPGLGDVRLMSFLETKVDSLSLVTAHQHGDIMLWDSESLQVRDHIAPSKKDEGRAATCWVCVNVGGDPFAFLSRGSTGLERVGLSSRRVSKGLKIDGKWKATSIAYSPRQLVVAGSDSGDLRFFDPKTLSTLHTFSPSGDGKGQTQMMSSILRSAVVSLSFCPQQPHMLLSSFQRGGLALWNLNTSSLDAAAATSSGRLVDAHFHPWMPVILTLSDRGDVSAWHVSTPSAARQAELQESGLLQPCNLARL
eukprot:CAMPEP_0172164484 /NCGR_PEP_ID=MMETSP1050-20130122/7871_1 /TAXON_ID=233186 /ORGANISM="Cryptomonas curvata, Strain CCAP979/52" /LENGTH=304 /DNA_ID=CAMNT_0012834827 /DNA_START=314 /DNA_END=1225 /DNA_ORIENTATION=+